MIPETVAAPVSKTPQPMAEGIKFKTGEWWCPYCGAPRRFRKDCRLGVLRCPVCGMSEKDFYVKSLNFERMIHR